jgi:hypothetical protein
VAHCLTLEQVDVAARERDPHRRIAFVAAFAMSNYSSTIGRIAKPFNPMLVCPIILLIIIINTQRLIPSHLERDVRIRQTRQGVSLRIRTSQPSSTHLRLLGRIAILALLWRGLCFMPLFIMYQAVNAPLSHSRSTHKTNSWENRSRSVRLALRMLNSFYLKSGRLIIQSVRLLPVYRAKLSSISRGRR